MSRVSLIEQLYKKRKSALEFNYDKLWAPPIMSIFTPYDIQELYRIATSLRLSSRIKEKYQMINRVMNNRGFVKTHAGTNRIVYKCLENPTFVAKVALDKVGLKDTAAEFKNQEFFKPFCCKIFEVHPSGVIGFVERVNPITSIEEFYSVSDDIFNMMYTKIIGKYVVDDLGAEKFMNYGIRQDSNGHTFGPVIIDFPYAYELDGAKLICNRPINTLQGTIPCGGDIDYDASLSHLRCTKCGKEYKAMDLMKQNENINIVREGDLIMRVKIVKNGKVVFDSGRTKATPIETTPIENTTPSVVETTPIENPTPSVVETESIPIENTTPSVVETIPIEEPTPSVVETESIPVENPTPIEESVPVEHVVDDLPTEFVNFNTDKDTNKESINDEDKDYPTEFISIKTEKADTDNNIYEGAKQVSSDSNIYKREYQTPDVTTDINNDNTDNTDDEETSSNNLNNLYNHIEDMAVKTVDYIEEKISSQPPTIKDITDDEYYDRCTQAVIKDYLDPLIDYIDEVCPNDWANRVKLAIIKGSLAFSLNTGLAYLLGGIYSVTNNQQISNDDSLDVIDDDDYDDDDDYRSNRDKKVDKKYSQVTKYKAKRKEEE